MTRKISTFLVATIFLASVFTSVAPSKQVYAATQAKVNATTLNVREKPTTSSKVIGKYTKGQTVTITQQQNGWSKVPVGKKTGWVSSKYVTVIKPTASKAVVPSGTKYYVTATTLNIRKSASTSAARVDSVKKNAAVTLYEKKGSWGRVKTASGKTGWASLQYLTTKAPATPKPAPKPIAKAPVKYYVTATSLNIRKEPKTTATSITSVKKNQVVSLYEKKGTWGKVKTAAGKTGWASLQYLTTKAPITPKPAPPVQVPVKYYVTATSLNVRSGPSTSSGIVTSVKKNEVVSLYEKKGTWGRIKTASGKTGWVSLSFLTTKAPVKPTPVSPQQPTTTGVKGKVIVLDPGHGGTDVGAPGKVQNERNLTLQTANEVKALLVKAGAKVIMTRTSNTSRKLELSERVAISHKYNAQAFVSIHYNSGSSEATGIETYFYPTYSDEAKLAAAIQQELIKQTQMRDRKVKNTSAFYVIKNNRMPSILAELGFISNPVEEKRLITKEYQQQAARGIFNGLNKYFSQ
ncbi:SH3 domain-containing protein [Bacillus sp. V59.32b]|uniref:SH3 domain-containing protein n=1 Tax=Bacillus sp. V59.32b TaxID=1758642 RepID=UPI000E3E317A|nr:SH3 domain-containing protein [Bacillus sp. V59.32b]RFU62707.1 hypothetical protein D0463_13075 [Bacillus sp. V59.32b]